MTTITPEIRQAIEQAGNAPIRIEDPETKTVYVLVKEEVYEGLRAWLEPLTSCWDDPEMDVYNDYDAHKKS